MTWQRTVGIDLAIKGNHVAAGCSVQGDFIRKKPFRFDQTLQGYESLIKEFVELDTRPEEILFIMEATGNVWLPLSCFLKARGFKVYLVKTQKVSDLRKFFKKYTKSDFNDAQSLAKQPFVDKDSMHEFIVPEQDIFTLRRKVRQYAKYGDDISRYKNRIHSIFQLANPKLVDCLGEHKFTQAALYFYENFANPFKVKKIGQSRFQKTMLKNIHGNADFYEASVNHCQLLEDMQTHIGDILLI